MLSLGLNHLFKNKSFRLFSIYGIQGQSGLFGGNDDYFTSDSYYWVDPGDDFRYGVIWIGQPDNVQQGVNECGLAYDANGLPERM